MTQELTEAEKQAKIERFGFDKPQSLAERVDSRLRAEWPGMHTTELRGLFEVAPIRAGGATDALLSLVRKIVEEESTPPSSMHYRMGRTDTATGKVIELSVMDYAALPEDKLLPHGEYTITLHCGKNESVRS